MVEQCKQALIQRDKERGFTESHMLVVDARPFGGGQTVEEKLTQTNIIANKMPLPTDQRLETEDADRPAHGSRLVSSYRMGTPWVTRLGIKEAKMGQIAHFIRRVLVDGEAPSDVSAKVVSFMKSYPTRRCIILLTIEPREPAWNGTATSHEEKGVSHAGNVYRELAQRLDALPNGVPATESGLAERFIRTLEEEHIDYTEYHDFDDAFEQLAH